MDARTRNVADDLCDFLKVSGLGAKVSVKQFEGARPVFYVSFDSGTVKVFSPREIHVQDDTEHDFDNYFSARRYFVSHYPIFQELDLA